MIAHRNLLAPASDLRIALADGPAQGRQAMTTYISAPKESDRLAMCLVTSDRHARCRPTKCRAAASDQRAQISQSGAFCRRGRPGNASTTGSRGAIQLPVAVPEPFVNDLPVRAGPPSHQPGVLQFAADLVDPLPGRDAGPGRDLIIIKRTRSDHHQEDAN
jgi:hypothetical protein